MASVTTIPGSTIGARPTPATIDTAEREAWLLLATIPGLGARRRAALIGRFGTAVAALDAPRAAWADLPHFSPRLVGAIRRADRTAAAALLARAAAAEQWVLVPSDGRYPARLRTIPDPPPILFAAGDLTLLDRPAVAIVGSRDHSRYGAVVATRLAEAAAEARAVVVSGMARGLDAVAQAAALNVGGTTIGVLGAGVDVVYPARNRALFARVRDTGLLLSEHPPGDRPTAGAFPRRNRIISGLANALVVVEAALGSGTLITVQCALEQGREVFAVPGPITSATSAGTNRLLRDGATPILAWDDLPALLGLGTTPAPTAPLTCTLGSDEARVLGALTSDPRHIDELALDLGLPIGTLLGALLGLELGGLVEHLPGTLFRRRRGG
jgi:DNA processing protein